MNIGLYSELARKNIPKIKKEISQLGIGATDIEMKSFRDNIVNSNLEHHKHIVDSSDFYSMSSLRDLLFHVQEHRFKIPQIKDYLSKLNLKFCGFESNTIFTKFKLANTNKGDLYDLDKWHEYEEANPASFAGMYQFWCQKID